MAMNKKEQAEMAELRKKLAIAKAFVRTLPVEKDVPVPLPSWESGKYSHGFDFNSYNNSIGEYWSSSVSHYTSNPIGKTGYISGSQRGVSLYSTRLLALKALRHAVENNCAAALADIDAQIIQEEAA